MTNIKVKPYRCNNNDKSYKTARKLAGHDGAILCFSCADSKCLTHSFCSGGPAGTIEDASHQSMHLVEDTELVPIHSIHNLRPRSQCKTCVRASTRHTTHWFLSRPNATAIVYLIESGKYAVTERKFLHTNSHGVTFIHTECHFIRDGVILRTTTGEQGDSARQWVRRIQENVAFEKFITQMEQY